MVAAAVIDVVVAPAYVLLLMLLLLCGMICWLISSDRVGELPGVYVDPLTYRRILFVDSGDGQLTLAQLNTNLHPNYRFINAK